MDIDPVILAIPIYFLLIGVELVVQLVKRKKIYRTNDAISNISCGIFSQVTNALWGVLSIGIYQYVYQYWAIQQITATIWSNIALFLLVDMMYYWSHRASHEINFLWNINHVVHHQSEDYNFSVALRQASFGGIFSMFFYLPLALLGFNTYSFLVVKGLNLIYQFWIHTETIGKLPRWFEFLFNTPSHHRVHHGRNPKYIDKNHAGTLIIWDRLFGTFKEEEERPTYGVTKPTNTWNPVWANLMPIIDMTNQVKATPGFINKVRVLAFKPGWRPKELGGYQAAPEITTLPEKYNLHPAYRLTQYILAQFIIILTFTSTFLFLFNGPDTSILVKLSFAGFIMWSIAHLGLMMEGRHFWIRFEYVRLIVSGFILSYLLIGWTGIGIAAIFLLSFIFWLYRVSKK